MKNYLPILLLALITTACNEKKKIVDLDQIGVEQFEGGFEIEKNQTQTFALILKETSAKNNDAFPKVNALIVDMKTGEILARPKTARGKILWESDHVVRVTSLPGIPNPNKPDANKPQIKRIDVQQLQKKMDTSNSTKS